MFAVLALAVATSLPPVEVTVYAAPDVTRAFVDDMLAETNAIWRDAGVTFAWRVVDRATEGGDCLLRVTIDTAAPPVVDGDTAIAWIAFDPDDPRAAEIHLRVRKALGNLERLRRISGAPVVTRVGMLAMLAPAMARALAHELGHYLLGSDAHSDRCLMHAPWSEDEFFGPDRPRVCLNADERRAIVLRIVRAALVAGR